MPVVKTPLRILDVLDSEGKITNHEVQYQITFEASTPDEEEIAKNFTARQAWEEVTPEVASELRAGSDNALTAENKKLHQQIADMQNVADATAKAAAEQIAALNENIIHANDTIIELASRHNALASRLQQIAKLSTAE